MAAACRAVRAPAREELETVRELRYARPYSQIPSTMLRSNFTGRAPYLTASYRVHRGVGISRTRYFAKWDLRLNLVPIALKLNIDLGVPNTLAVLPVPGIGIATVPRSTKCGGRCTRRVSRASVASGTPSIHKCNS